MNFIQSGLLGATRAITSSTRLKGRYVLSEILVDFLNVKKDTIDAPLGKYQLDLSMNDLIQRQIYFGLYDTSEIALLKRILKPGDTFFDIGANIGYYSLNASQFVGDGGSVHSFEPIPANFARLQHYIERNHIQNIHPNQVAVGETEGSLTLHYGDENQGNSGWASVVPSDRRKKSIVVPTITIDNYVQQNNIARVKLIKLDIEGAELLALSGMQKLLASSDAPDLLVEVNPFFFTKQGKDSRTLTEWLATHGYTLHLIDEQTTFDPSTIATKLINLYCDKKSS